MVRRRIIHRKPMTITLPILLLSVTAFGQPMIPQAGVRGPMQSYYLPGYGTAHVHTLTQPDGTVTASGTIYSPEGTYTLKENIIEDNGFECHDYALSPPAPPQTYALTYTPGISEMSINL